MTLRRLGPICGLLFTPLYAAFTVIPELPEAGYSDEQVLDLYREGSGAILLGSLLMALAGAALLTFLADLHDRLRPAGTTANLALGGGLVYVAMLFVAGTLWGGYAGGSAGPLEDAPDLEHSVTLARVLTDMGFAVLLVYGLVAAAVLIAATSAAARRAGVLPRAVVSAGYVVAPLLLAGFTWVPQFLVPLWVLAVSVTLLRHTSAAQPERAPVTAP